MITPEIVIDFVKEQLQTNQFSQGAVVAGVIGAVIAWGRSLPGRIWHGITKLLTIDVRFNSDSPDYPAISRYISTNIINTTLSRNFVFSTEIKDTYEDGHDEIRELTAGYGKHYGFYKGRFVIVSRSMEEGSQTAKFKENTVLTFLTRSKKTVYAFSQEIAQAAGANSLEFTNVPIWINASSWWTRMGKFPLRKMASVFTANNAGDDVVKAIKEFEAQRDEHHRLGLPHHLGIMLHGEPGCGKSSLIHAVATETKRSIFYLNIGSVESDADLTSLLSGSRDWSKIILAIEDVDAAGVKVTREEDEDTKNKKISLSAFLNVLDGLLCPDGLVVIATTNHHDRLDPALKREGRFDKTIELGKLGYKDFVRMAELFGKNPKNYNITEDVSMTGAQMRAVILSQ